MYASGKKQQGRPVKGWRKGVDKEMLTERCKEMLQGQLPNNIVENKHMWHLGVVGRQSVL